MLAVSVAARRARAALNAPQTCSADRISTCAWMCPPTATEDLIAMNHAARIRTSISALIWPQKAIAVCPNISNPCRSVARRVVDCAPPQWLKLWWSVHLQKLHPWTAWRRVRLLQHLVSLLALLLSVQWFTAAAVQLVTWNSHLWSRKHSNLWFRVSTPMNKCAGKFIHHQTSGHVTARVNHRGVACLMLCTTFGNSEFLSQHNIFNTKCSQHNFLITISPCRCFVVVW